MANKGVLINSHVVVSYAQASQDTITVNFHCRDLREGVADNEKEMTFTNCARGFFPNPGGPEYELEFSKAWKKIEGWLKQMGVDDCSHEYVIESILKCSYYQTHDSASLSLDVHLEISEENSKQSRLHPREDDLQDNVCLVGDALKRFRM